MAWLDHLDLADKFTLINNRCIAVGVDAVDKSVPHLLTRGINSFLRLKSWCVVRRFTLLSCIIYA